jgi:hypothetical protein
VVARGRRSETVERLTIGAGHANDHVVVAENAVVAGRISRAHRVIEQRDSADRGGSQTTLDEDAKCARRAVLIMGEAL